MPGQQPISPLVLAELYDSSDPSFLDRLLEYRGNFKPLLGLIERWKKDRRSWARRQKLEYILRRGRPYDSRVIFKRFFKHAWAENDHEIMSAFLVACDRLVRRKRAKRYQFLQGLVEIREVLRVRPNDGVRLFLNSKTPNYLRRRAWRYFRRLGFKDAVMYRGTIAQALVRYTDDDVRLGENLLDNWGLMHACFGKSPQLAFNSRHTNLAPSGALGAMEAAPMFERHWSAPDAAGGLLNILLEALCRPVRVWAIQLLKRHHKASLARIDPAMLAKLIDHADADVAGFAAELLLDAHAASAFPMSTWMSLLATRNPAVVAMVVEAFRRHVQPERVSLEQAVELATRPAVPVARLGFEFVQARSVKSAADRALIAKLASAECAALAGEIARFAVGVLNQPGSYELDALTRFFDSRLLSMRVGSFAALAEGSSASADPAFWARLFESPYDDVRIALVERLKGRASLPGASEESLALLWSSVLLNIHRGGRSKLSALTQISQRIMNEPVSAEKLLPVLVIAIRSVRPPEARHGLAAIVSAVEARPQLATRVREQLPELQLELMGGAR